MKEVNVKKQKRLTIVAVVTLVAIIAGATYAYFQVGTSNLFGTSTINAAADNIGSVILTGEEASLSMDLTAVDMMWPEHQFVWVGLKCTNPSSSGNSCFGSTRYFFTSVEECNEEKNKYNLTLSECNGELLGDNINYYATPTGRSTNVSDKEHLVATATVSPNTDTNYYHCTYTLEVSQSYSGDKNMYRIFKGLDQVNNTTYSPSENELILTVNGVDYDLSLQANSLTKEIPGEFYIKGAQTREITAGFRLVNRVDKNQNLLAGSGVNISIGVKANTFSCAAEEEPEETIVYWTYEGVNVGYGDGGLLDPHKISDYRNLNVWKRTYNDRTYSYATEAACTSAIEGSETCSESVQPYFIKETITPTTNTYEEDIYEIQYDNNGEVVHYGTYEGKDACEADMQEGDECVKIHSIGDLLYKSTYEVCENINGTVICAGENAWENVESYKTRYETAGLTCQYWDQDSSKYIATKPEEGALECNDDTFSDSIDSFSLVSISHSGDNIGRCYIEGNKVICSDDYIIHGGNINY